jgi:hypothetical protein
MLQFPVDFLAEQKHLRIQLYTGAQVNFGDLTSYLTYAI